MFDLSVKFLDFGSYKAQSFHCMGGLCEVLTETSDVSEAKKIFAAVYGEAKRLEKKYSRYDTTNLVYQINNANGRSVDIDDETFRLLSFADSLYNVSHGLFDITSGVLRKAWTFDGGSQIPDPALLSKLVQNIGWKKVKLDKKSVRIPTGWQLDFGGIGKEYAVDSCCEKARAVSSVPTLVNLGGDIAVTGPKRDKSPWRIDVDQSEEKLSLFNGAVATSGDKNKFVMQGDKKLSHLLNPKTGWPVEGAPRSVTVVANTCVEAGALSTLALLQGPNAERFLKLEATVFKIIA
jgi:thiamine biosynthesis lipoprotein